MVEACAHMTLISAALSYQNHINYFRAFFLDEQRDRIKSKSLLLSRFLNLLPRFAVRWAVPSCRFWHHWGLSVKFHTILQHSKYLTCSASQSSWQRILSLPHSQQITANFQALGI